MKDEKFEIIGNEYYILRNLDYGGTSKVYLIKSIKTEKNYVAKIYNSKSKYYENEVKILKKISLLNVSNIIRLISYGEEEIKEDSNSEPENKQYIILDYLPNKDLFSYIKNNNEINEQEALHFFKEIIKAVQQCHNNNICHRDLKMENILLDENNYPVLCDFGFSALIEGSDGQTKFTEYFAPSNYIPPEINLRIPYDGKKSDIFSLGVILFALLFGKFGFTIAIPSNNIYKFIVKKRYDKYWEEIGKVVGNNKVKSISPKLKELYVKMVSNNPNERPSIETVIECINNI